MNAGTWVAVVAAVIAAVSLHFNWRYTRTAVEQTKIQRQLRIDAAQPYVWADIAPDEVSGVVLQLVVGNSGQTIATNVRVTVDPPLEAIDRLKERFETAQSRLASGIQSVAPGRTFMWPIGQGFNILKDDRRQAYTFTITADGPFGPVPPLTYVVDMSDWRGVLHRPAGSLFELTQVVKDFATKIDSTPNAV
jgi:hypothetical protein